MTVQTPTPFPPPEPLQDQVTFDRHELGAILRLYGQMVAAGEWRDYGLSFLREAMAKRMVDAGGIGLTESLLRALGTREG